MYYFYLLTHNLAKWLLDVLSKLDVKVAKIYRYCHLYIRFYERFNEKLTPDLYETMDKKRSSNEYPMVGRFHNKQVILKIKTPKGRYCYAVVKSCKGERRIATFLTKEMVQNTILKQGFFYKNSEELTFDKGLI